MTTLDGVERSFDAETVLVCDRDGPYRDRRDHGRRRSPRSPTTTTRVLLEVATWNGVNILRTSRMLGLRSEASNRFEKQLHPELAMRAQRVASRLMVELCGAKLVPGTIDVAAEIPRAARDRAARRRGSSACSGCAIEPDAAQRVPAPARLRGRARRRATSRPTVPVRTATTTSPARST